MVKSPLKTLTNPKTPINHNSHTLTEYPKKSRQQIYQENYQKNKERKKQQRRERYQQQKLQAQQTENEQLSKYYGAEAIKVLMSFKEYTELNQAKRKLWLDFNWTLQDCQKSFKKGYADIVFIMKLEQVAGKLVRDFWDTARNEEKQKGKNWNLLDYEEKQRLIRYWGREKARIENGYIDEWERLENESEKWEKEVKWAKFHEERGKINCQCEWCAYHQEIHKEVVAKIKKERKKIIEDYEKEQKTSDKEECPECGKMRVLDEENGICKKCMSEYE